MCDFECVRGTCLFVARACSRHVHPGHTVVLPSVHVLLTPVWGVAGGPQNGASKVARVDRSDGAGGGGGGGAAPIGAVVAPTYDYSAFFPSVRADADAQHRPLAVTVRALCTVPCRLCCVPVVVCWWC